MRDRWPKGAAAPNLEAQLWRAVSHAGALGDSLSCVTVHLAEHVPLLAAIARRFDEEPARLTTVAWAQATTRMPPGHTDAPAEALVSARTDVADALLLELRSMLTHGILRWRDELPRGLAQAILPVELNARVLVAPIRAEGVAGVVLFVFSNDSDVRQCEQTVDVALPPLEVAFKNDHHFHEVTRLREALRADREALLSRLGRLDICEVVIGERAGLSRVMSAVEQVARTDAPVLVLGETGSGKEVVARAIHERSARCKGPVVRVNCGAIPTELIDSELFGHERGAFTGATSSRKGWFERADGGTLFLDEIGELPAAAQVRLLRVLQDGSLERVGGHHTVHVDVRIVAATHRDLSAMVAGRAFREDLWYRLSVFPIRLPALRERLEDLPALAQYFADRAGKRLGNGKLSLTGSDLDLLHSYAWPGNVRELSAVIERAAILGGGRALRVAAALETLSGASQPPSSAALAPSLALERLPTLDEAMAAHIRRALAACHGRIEGPFGAAQVLGINPHTLRARMRRLGVVWASFRGRHASEP